MSRRKRADLLLVGQTPPPFHGQSVVTAMLFGHEWEDLDVERLRMAYSATVGAVGAFSLKKIVHLFALVFRTWKMVLFRRPRILYYLPASPALVPVLRDLVYLGLVRWFFPKIVFHYHAGGLDEFVSKRFWLRGMASIAYGRADVSIEVNEWLKPAGEYFKAKRNVAVMNGVRVGVARRKRPSADRFQILYVGLLCPEKGVSEMIEMVAALKEYGRECELRCVGGWVSEEYRESVTEKVEDLGVGECVVWAGVLHGDEKWQAYADADCFIFPSHHPTETFGLVLVEAMAFGLPVVTTKWRGIPTVVGDSGCAELCEVRRPDEWAEAVRRIMGDDSRRKEMGELARTRFESDFTEAKFLKRMDSVFQSLLDR